MTTKPLPSLEYLKECFELSDESPSGLVWKVRPRHHFNSDRGWNLVNTRNGKKPAGNLSKSNSDHYYRVNVNGSLFYSHRIVFSLHHDRCITELEHVDHCDRNTLNNSPHNLRLANHSENTCNTRKRSNNTSGFKGVHWHKSNKCWCFQIKHAGKRHFIFSPSAEKAFELGCELRQKLHRQFCHHGE